MDVEMQNHRYRDLLFRADEAFLEEERKQEALLGTIRLEHEGYDRMEAYYKARESKLMVEIVDLKDKAGDFGLRNDYLDSRVLELEDTVEHLRRSLKDSHDNETKRGFKKMYLEA